MDLKLFAFLLKNLIKSAFVAGISIFLKFKVVLPGERRDNGLFNTLVPTSVFLFA